jgi:hypothetical protein
MIEFFSEATFDTQKNEVRSRDRKKRERKRKK